MKLQLFLLLLIAPSVIFGTRCQQRFNKATGKLQTPGSPYNSGTYILEGCSYHIQVDKWKIVELSFEKLDIKMFMGGCHHAYLEVYDGRDKSSSLITRLCGSTIPQPVRSTGRDMYIYFYAFNNVKNDFKAKYKAVNSDKCGVSVVQPNHGIVGGADTIIKKHPWQVSIQACRSNNVCGLCGGSIVAENWVITAAHCIYGIAKDNIKIYAGSNFPWSSNSFSGKIFSAMHKVDHEKYNAITITNDIALIKIHGAFELSSDETRAICLADVSDSTAFDGERCAITGWGITDVTDSKSLSKILQEAKVPVASRSECMSTEFRDYCESYIAAGYPEGGIGVCHGDSGGPLACQRKDGSWVLAGITSFGNSCGNKNEHQLYTRVSYYANWIKKTMAS